MIRRHIIIGATLATFALASCGGGDDDPSPTPTPTGSVTPTPTASPTYVSLPLAAAVQLGAISADTSYTGDPSTGAVTLGVVGTEIATGRVTLATSPLIDSATYVINVNNTEESRFVKANLTTQPTPAASEFVFRTNDTATAGKFAQLEFLNNTIPTTSGLPYGETSDAGLQFDHVSYAGWWRGDSTTGAKRMTYTVFGYPTVATDLPKTGTVTYAARFAGRFVSVAGSTTTVDRASGAATLSINYATGQVDLSIALTKPAAGGGTTPIGTITGQGAIPVGNVQFSGAFGSGSPLSGTFVGSLFGSAGKEVGITFAASGATGGSDYRVVGTVVGKK